MSIIFGEILIDSFMPFKNTLFSFISIFTFPIFSLPLFYNDDNRPFSQKIGFLAQCGTEYYPVSPVGLKNKNRTPHIPDEVKILLYNTYYADGRAYKRLDSVGGAIIPRESCSFRGAIIASY